jgi:hypothetical protein
LFTLTAPSTSAADEKGPAFRRGLHHYPSFLDSQFLGLPDLLVVLIVLPALAALLLTGLVALALRILLLLAGLVTATLLLAGALTGVLVLLARILVLLLRHWGKLPC